MKAEIAVFLLICMLLFGQFACALSQAGPDVAVTKTAADVFSSEIALAASPHEQTSTVVPSTAASPSTSTQGLGTTCKMTNTRIWEKGK